MAADPGALTDPGYNATTAATLILRDLVRRYHGDLDKVLAAYHSGRGAVEDPRKISARARRPRLSQSRTRQPRLSESHHRDSRRHGRQPDHRRRANRPRGHAMSSVGLTTYRLTYEICPIILTNGIATFMPGGMLPIISLTESVNFVAGVLSGGGPEDLDSYFAHFQPMAGGKLISQEIATFPFANQATAGNAAITKPLPISLMMVCPAKGDSGMLVKIATMQMLKATLGENHNAPRRPYLYRRYSRFFLCQRGYARHDRCVGLWRDETATGPVAIGLHPALDHAPASPAGPERGNEQDHRQLAHSAAGT